MKICPTCNRTYAEETLNFCLDDGATLLYSSGQGRGRSLPPTRDASPAPTEVLDQQSIDSSTPPLTTIASLQPPKLYTPKAPAPPTEKNSRKRKVAMTIGASLVLLIGAGALIILSIVWLSQRGPSDSDPKTPDANANVRPSPRPTATPEDEIWSETNDAASLTGENLTYYPGTTPEQCKADCEKNQRCKGYTFIRAGAYNPGESQMCYLASAVKGFAAHSCCISGVKRE